MAEEQNDPWREQLSEMIAEIDTAFDEWLSEWVAADEAAELQAAAQNLDANQVVEAVGNVIQSIEGWYRDQFNLIVAEEGRRLGIRPDRWLCKTNGWLMSSARGSVVSLKQAAAAFESAAEELAESSARWSGVGGFLRGAARGAIDPLDGLAALFGESSIDKEGQLVERALKSAAKRLQAAVASTQETVDALVVDRWNSELTRVGDEMEAHATSARVLPSPASSASDSAFVQPTHSSRSIWLGAVLLIALLGFGGYWFFGRTQGPSSPTPQVEMAEVPASALRSGPSETFSVVSQVPSPVYAKVLDRSVPGWLKVQLASGDIGWTPIRTADAK